MDSVLLKTSFAALIFEALISVISADSFPVSGPTVSGSSARLRHGKAAAPWLPNRSAGKTHRSRTIRGLFAMGSSEWNAVPKEHTETDALAALMGRSRPWFGGTDVSQTARGPFDRFDA